MINYEIIQTLWFKLIKAKLTLDEVENYVYAMFFLYSSKRYFVFINSWLPKVKV